MACFPWVLPGITASALSLARAAPAQNDHRDLRPVEQAKVHVCIAKPAADIQGRFALPVKPGIPCGEQPPVRAEQPAHERQPHDAAVAVPGQHGLHAEGAPLRQLVVTVRQQQEKGGLSGLRVFSMFLPLHFFPRLPGSLKYQPENFYRSLLPVW